MPTKTTKPEGYPKRPVSAFISYMNFNRADFVAQLLQEGDAGAAAPGDGQPNPQSTNITRVSRKAKSNWDALSAEEKKPWTDKATEALEHFNAAVKAFNEKNPSATPPVKSEQKTTKASSKKKERPLGTPRKTATAFIIFSVEERSTSVAEITIKGETPTFAAIASCTAAKWRALSDADKDKWKQKALELQEAAKEEARLELEQAQASAPTSLTDAPAAEETAPDKPVAKPKRAKKAKAAAPEVADDASSVAPADADKVAPPKKRAKKNSAAAAPAASAPAPAP